MKSAPVINAETIYGQNMNALRLDAQAASMLLCHQQLGAITLPTNPSNTQTLTLTINSTAIVVTFVAAIGSTPGNVLIGGTAAITSANLNALLDNPSITNANQVALSAANQTLVSYLSFSLSGTTTTVGSLNQTNIAPQTTFTAATTATGGAYAANTMRLYVEPGNYFVGNTRVSFLGASTPTIVAPVSNPRIDLVCLNSAGSVSVVTGVEGASPAVPTYPLDKVVVAEVMNIVAETALYDFGNQQASQGYIQNDIRPYIRAGRFVSQTGAEIFAATDTGSANAYAAAYLPANTALTDGLELSFRAANANTGDSTFAPDGLSAQHVYKWKNVVLDKNDILAGQLVTVRYDLTNTAWQMVTPPSTLSNVSPATTFTAGESITAGQPVCSGYYQADGGIKYDSKAGGNSTAASISTAFVVGANTNTLLIVAIVSTQAITAMTFNGTNFTSLGNANGPHIYYLLGATTGSHTFAVTFASSTQYAYTISSYYNVKQSGQPDASASAANNSSFAGTSTVSSAPVAQGSLIFAAVNWGNGAGTQPSSGGGITNNSQFQNTGSSLLTVYSGDLGVNVVADAETLSLAAGGGSNLNQGPCVTVSFSPITAPSFGYVLLASADSSASYSTPTRDTFRAKAFIGFALASASATQSISIQTSGVTANQTALVPFQQYYLANTAGTIARTPGNNSRKVGISNSATQIEVTNIW